MFGMRIAVACEDEEVKKAIAEELGKFHQEIITDPKDFEKADVAIVDLRSCERTGWTLEIPRIAILSRAGDFKATRCEGAADYVLYPFMPGDLAFRLWLLRDGIFKEAAAAGPREVGLVVNFDNYEITADGEPLNLTYREFEMLRMLIRADGKVVTRRRLLKRVCGRDYCEGNRTVDVHIRRLRAKLGTKYGDLIETVRSVGYRLRRDDDVQIVDGRLNESTR